eukprot:991994_1
MHRFQSERNQIYFEVYPLGVCVQVQVSEDVITSNKMECDEDDEAVFKAYATDDCTLASTTQDSPVDFDDVVCDTDLNRCGFAIHCKCVRGASKKIILNRLSR